MFGFDQGDKCGLKIEDHTYVVGESAERHGVHTQRKGLARYTRDYYGFFAAAVLGRLYEWGGKYRSSSVTPLAM